MAQHPPKLRNEHAAALFHRAGNANVGVAVDTRPKIIPKKRDRISRQQIRIALRRGEF